MPHYIEFQTSGYFHPVDEKGCEKLLTDQKPGTAVIRPFKQIGVCFGLSYVNNAGKIIHTDYGIDVTASNPPVSTEVYLPRLAANFTKRLGDVPPIQFLKRDPKIQALEKLFVIAKNPPFLLVSGNVNNLYQEPFQFSSTDGITLDYIDPIGGPKPLVVKPLALGGDPDYQPPWDPEKADERGLCWKMGRPVGVEASRLCGRTYDWRSQCYQVQHFPRFFASLRNNLSTFRRDVAEFNLMQAVIISLEAQYKQAEDFKPHQLNMDIKALSRFSITAKNPVLNANLPTRLQTHILTFLTGRDVATTQLVCRSFLFKSADMNKAPRVNQDPRAPFFALHRTLSICKEATDNDADAVAFRKIKG